MVPRHDLSDDAQRDTIRVVQVAPRERENAAFETLCDPGEVAEPLGQPADLRLELPKRPAGAERVDPCELGDPRLETVGNAVEDTGPGSRRKTRPFA